VRSEAFGELLQRHRAAAGLSQEALAARSGLSREAISMLERGVRLAPRTSTVAILGDALRLRPPDRETFFAAAQQAAGRARSAGAEAPVATPHELPRPPADFTGREREVAAVRELLHDSAIATVCGMGGIGKSALAVVAAHGLAGVYPDGQLYVNLHGATAGLAPAQPLDALRHLLRSLGQDPGTIPPEVEVAAARFRSLAAGRRLLVLLDNARDAEQVRPLLPGNPACGVLVTSREALSTLEGARMLRLDALPGEQAVDLLGRMAGRERVAAEAETAAELMRRCGRLPLAIRIVGARLAARPLWAIRDLTEHMADATRRLEELQAGDLAVRASFEVSLEVLRGSAEPGDQAAAAAFGLLALPDGPDLGIAAAARLLDRDDDAARALLERLVDAQLLETPRAGRYEFHDLVREFARTVAAERHTGARRLAALAAALGFYAATARRTMGLLRPGSWRVTGGDPPWAAAGLELADSGEALAWLETERANLLQVARQAEGLAAADGPAIFAELATELARMLFGFFVVRGNWHDCVLVNEIAVRVAREPRDRALALVDLGTACMRLGRHDEAVARQVEGVAALRELGERRELAVGLTNLSISQNWLGRYDDALASLRESLAIYEELGDQAGRANCLNNVGLVYERLGRYEEAIGWQERSLALCRELGDRRLEAACLNCLGACMGRLGRSGEALDRLHEAVAVCRDLGARLGEADCLNDIGVVNRGLGRLVEAEGCHEESLAIFREMGSRRSQVLVLRDLGDTLVVLGRGEEAREAWREALAISEGLTIPEAEEVRDRLLSSPSPGTGEGARRAGGGPPRSA
jgi:tetratricopeptide (TPR) repeat protein/transcriptional regulator with XRE-family HTH domain